MEEIMSHSATSPLEALAGGLLATPTARLPYQHDVLLRSYVLERPDGNVIVYDSPGISETADAIRDLGGASRLLINHARASESSTPIVYERFMNRSIFARSASEDASRADLPDATASDRRSLTRWFSGGVDARSASR